MITDRRRCRSIPTYSRSTGTFFRREGVALSSSSVVALETPRREEALNFETVAPAMHVPRRRRRARRTCRAPHAAAATRCFIASRIACPFRCLDVVDYRAEGDCATDLELRKVRARLRNVRRDRRAPANPRGGAGC